MASTGPVRVVRSVRGEDAAAWAAALGGGARLDGARTLKAEGGARVLAATMLGREVVVKVREIRGPWERLKCALGLGKGDRHWRGAALLAGKGVATARVFVLARADAGAREMLAMERVAGPTLLGVMAAVRRGEPGAPGVRAQHALARAAGAQIARMGELFNRDHKPSNLIVRDGEIVVIDCEGVRRAVIPGAARMFASLLIEPTGCGVAPRRSLRMRAALAWAEAGDPRGGRAANRAAAREVWAEAARVVRHHGDPTPRVDPLG